VPRLSEADYRRALGFLYEAGEVDGPDPFPEPLRDSFATLLHADTIWHCRVADDAGVRSRGYTVKSGQVEIRWGWGSGAHEGGLPPAVVEALCACPREEDPLPGESAPLNRPYRRSDLVSTREWHRRGRWAYVDRPLGVRDWTRIWLGSRRRPIANFEVDNCRRRWDDRIVDLLGSLAPHLEQLIRRADARAATPGYASELTARERDILALVAEGHTNAALARILWISPNTVRKHLENAFEKLGVHTRTEAVARAFGGYPASVPAADTASAPDATPPSSA
jgi:DNA-binding CsgD family transcriptional regulator